MIIGRRLLLPLPLTGVTRNTGFSTPFKSARKSSIGRISGGKFSLLCHFGLVAFPFPFRTFSFGIFFSAFVPILHLRNFR